RLTIAKVLFGKKQHVSADQLLEMVRREDSTVSRATVYNTLNLFLNKKLIKALIIDKYKVVYDTNTSIHHHVYYVETGKLIDVSPKDVGLLELPRIPMGFEIEGADVVIRVRRMQSA
ncbi:MAG: transcriptional repressor, partial [Proteobacteria bacterium]|nr:transcriptional repressor [Pseudomonadota bacterium]